MKVLELFAESQIWLEVDVQIGSYYYQDRL